MPKLPENLQKVRNSIVLEAWDIYGIYLTKTDLAKIFGLSRQQIGTILDTKTSVRVVKLSAKLKKK